MQLQCQDTFAECQLGMIVGKVKSQLAIEIMLNVIAFGNILTSFNRRSSSGRRTPLR